MSENFDNTQAEMTQAPAEQTAQTPNPAEMENNNAMVESAFGKGLAATIVSCIPVGSIVAICLGNSALKLVETLRGHAAANGFRPAGKQMAAKTLGMIGKICGIVMTVFWGFYFLVLCFAFSMIASIR